MPDTIDRAQELDELHRAAALDRRRATAPAHRPATSACETCGEPIAPSRRAVLPHTVLCAACAAEAETLARRARRTGI